MSSGEIVEFSIRKALTGIFVDCISESDLRMYSVAPVCPTA